MSITYFEIGGEHRAATAMLNCKIQNFHAELDPSRYVKTDVAIPEPAFYFGIIAYDGDTPIGYAEGYLNSEKSDRTTQVVTLVSLYVEEGYRGQGVGTELLRRFETLARVKGARTMRLGLVCKNKAAFYFYLKHRYEVVEWRMERQI